MKVRTLSPQQKSGAITPETDWCHYAENAVAPICRKSGGAITPETKWLLYAGNSQQKLASRSGRSRRSRPAPFDGSPARGRTGWPACRLKNRGSRPKGEACCGQRTTGFLRSLHEGSQEVLDAKIDIALDYDWIVPRHPHNRRCRAADHRLQLIKHHERLVRRMFRIEQQPVESRTGYHFHRQVIEQAALQPDLRLADIKPTLEEIFWQWQNRNRHGFFKKNNFSE